MKIIRNFSLRKMPIGQALDKAFGLIKEHNSQLEGVMTAVHFGDTEKLPDELLARLLQHFNKYSLANEHLDNPDILGSAYEYLIREFCGCLALWSREKPRNMGDL